MDAHVVIATKGRAEALGPLLDGLSEQTVLPSSVTFVGTCERDVEGVLQHPFCARCSVTVLTAKSPGLCIQRNCGVEHLRAHLDASCPSTPFFVVFFDDDYRPAHDWLEQAKRVFEAQPDVAGLTGRVLADGVHGDPIGEDAGKDYLSGRRSPEAHWATGDEPRSLTSMYGCNMAFRDSVIRSCRFDENLPLYGWQEDRDYTSQASRLGRTIYLPGCRGVHLGSKSGRISGLRFGYSQIANPFYMWRKGTISARNGMRFVVRHLLSNSVRTLQSNERHDYPGRLKGNVMALTDLVRGSCHPTRILNM